MARYTFRELVIDSRTGLNPRKNFTLGNGNNYYITIKDIHDGKIVITDKTDKVDNAAIAIIKKRSRIKNGDILFTSIGRIGETAIVTNKDDTWDVNESVFIFTLNTDLITQEFFCALFQSKNVQDQLTRDSSGSTFKSIKMNQLEKMSFDIPCLEEQQKISNVLKETNKMIALRKEQLAKLDQLVKSRFIELFGDPISNPKGWKTDKTENHIDLLSGFPFDSSQYTENGINICGGLIIMPQRIEWKECKHWGSVQGYEEYTLKENDIVIALDRPWISEGFKIAMVDAEHLPALLIQRTARIRAIGINQLYLMYCFLLGGFDKHCNVTGSLVPHISAKDIRSFAIMLPPLELQEQFAAFVEQTDKSKLAIQQSLDKLELLKKSLMQEYFG